MRKSMRVLAAHVTVGVASAAMIVAPVAAGFVHQAYATVRPDSAIVPVRTDPVCATEDSDSGVLTVPRGIVTDDVGVITGVVEVHRTVVDGRYVLRVRYVGGAEWYTVSRCG